jgi:hypothetical protein
MFIFTVSPAVGGIALEWIAMSLTNENVEAASNQPVCWPDRLRRVDASGYLKRQHGLDRAPQTLAKLAVTGGGPEYERFGRIPYYRPAKLDEWVLSRLKRHRSTSEYRADAHRD